MGQRRLGIGVDRNVGLDEESAAGSGGIACRPQPASERECADLDGIAPQSESFQVQQFFESLGCVVRTGSNASKSRRRWAGRWVIGKRWYELP